MWFSTEARRILPRHNRWLCCINIDPERGDPPVTHACLSSWLKRLVGPSHQHAAAQGRRFELRHRSPVVQVRAQRALTGTSYLKERTKGGVRKDERRHSQ